MSQTNSNTSANNGTQPPMPRIMFKIINPLLKRLLRSPFHGRMSDRLMVLSFTGRKTGKHFSIPVGYLRSGKNILVFTHSAWRNNFKQPASVIMHIRGKDVKGAGHLVADPLRIQQIVCEMIAANGEAMSRRMELWVDRVETASPNEVLQATQGTYYIEIEMEE